MNNHQTLLLSLVAISAIASVLTLVFTVSNNQTSMNVKDWDTYTSTDDTFRFQKPKDVVVNCGDTTCILISPTETNPQPVPDMTISVHEGEVSFRTWEDFEIPYFKELVSSFSFEE